MPDPSQEALEMARGIEFPEYVTSRVPLCRCTEIVACDFHRAIALALDGLMDARDLEHARAVTAEHRLEESRGLAEEQRRALTTERAARLAAEALIEEKGAALHRYGHHEPACPKRSELSLNLCYCGLTAALTSSTLPPLPMVLHCPACGAQHVDAPEPDPANCYGCQHDAAGRSGKTVTAEWPKHTCWTNPPHKSHRCHGCRIVWRPADVPTVGVESIATRGQNDSAPSALRARWAAERNLILTAQQAAGYLETPISEHMTPQNSGVFGYWLLYRESAERLIACVKVLAALRAGGGT